MQKRAPFIEDLRGQAVLWMIFFHAAYDLTLFRVLHFNFASGFWFWLPRYIVLSFLICVGASLRIAYQKEILWPKFFKRFKKIALGALLVSIATYLLFPSRWVYFGTLHNIALSSLIGLIFVRRPKLSLFLGIAIFASMPLFGLTFKNLSVLTSVKSMDFIPIYPWFGAVLFGIFLSDSLRKIQYSFRFPWLRFFSQKAFIIYLIHQPLLYGLSYLVSLAMR